MFRKGVSIVVLLGFVAGQVAAMPHAHGDCTLRDDHDSRPHAHTLCVGEAGHRHAHHHDVADTRMTHSHPPVSQAIGEQDDHDSDAVYLANDISVFLASKITSVPTGGQVLYAVVYPVASSLTAAADYSAAAFFPNECSSSRPLYLELRALRI